MKLWQKFILLTLVAAMLFGGVFYFTQQSVSWNSGAVSQWFAPDVEENVSWNSGALAYVVPHEPLYQKSVSWNS